VRRAIATVGALAVVVAVAVRGRVGIAADAPAATPAGPSVPTIVVSRLGDGDAASIRAGLEKAAEGARLLVRAGRYRGGFAVTKGVEIVADGKPGEVVVESEGGACVTAAADVRTTIRGLVLRTKSPPDSPATAVLVTAGTLTLQACEVVSDGEGAVDVRGGGARVVLTACTVRGGRYAVTVAEGASATIDSGAVSDAGAVGIEVVGAGSTLDAKGVRVTGCGALGVRVAKGAKGRLEALELEKNAEAQVFVTSGATLEALRVVARGGTGFGGWVEGGARATFAASVFSEHGKSGLGVLGKGSSTEWKGGALSKNKGSGALVDDGASATFEDLVVDGNHVVGIEFRGAATGAIRRATLSGQATGAGVTVHQKADVKLHTVELSRNASDGLSVFGEGVVDARRCRLLRCKQSGASVDEKARLTIADSEVSENEGGGILVGPAELSAQRVTVTEQAKYGLWIEKDGRAALEDCTFRAVRAVSIKVEGELRVNASRIVDGSDWGVRFEDWSKGRIAATEVSGHRSGGVFVGEGAAPELVDCKLRKNLGPGVRVALGGKGTFEKCDLTGSTPPWDVADPLSVQRKGNRPNK
jgi:hypothetical protein